MTQFFCSDRRGNRTLIAISAVNLCILYPGTKAYYVWRNKQKDKLWNAMTPEVSLLSSKAHVRYH